MAADGGGLMAQGGRRSTAFAPDARFRRAAFVLVLTMLLGVAGSVVLANPQSWRAEWPRTDFTRHSIEYSEIASGGPPKDGIPAIDRPSFLPASDPGDLKADEPVISVQLGGEARAYPLRIMIWHEIVNDTVGGVPVAVTWCPLCNSSVVFDRRIGGRTLDFGTTGKLRHSDLVMYDRQTESWWQQFTGQAIVGEMLGAELKFVPARVESMARFRERFPEGKVLAPPARSGRAYGMNPYTRYDSAARPFLYRGEYSEKVPPLARVVAVDGKAWTLDLVRQRRRIEAGDLVIVWEPGQASPLDASDIARGRDIGNVVVQRRTENGFTDAVHDISFAFAFSAFHPDAPIISE
jgi:hypothetical protein